MSRLILLKHHNSLVSTDAESVEGLAKIKEGSEVYAELARARNTAQHRLFFALAAVVAESMDLPVETIRKDALIRLGYTTSRFDIDGRLIIEPMSMRHAIDDAAMTQEQFDAFMDKAVWLMASWIHADHKDLIRRYNELAADKRYTDYERQGFNR
jgi:Protein of unknown function (DUF1367)